MTRFKIRGEHYIMRVEWSRDLGQNWEEKNKADTPQDGRDNGGL